MSLLDWIPEGAFTWHGLLTIAGLLVYVIGSHALGQRRHPSAAIAWVMAILLIPEVGVPLYLVFGTRKLPKAARRPATSMVPVPADSPAPGWLLRLAAAMAMPPACGYDRLRVHRDGREARQALYELIDSAQQQLDLCTFILGRGEFGEALLRRLAARVRDGVRVRLLVDGVGALMGGRYNFAPARAVGIEVVRFVPPLQAPLHRPLRGRANLRNHRKLVIADGQRVWSGGRNLASEYFEGRGQQAPWIDLSFDASGQIAAQSAALFESDWDFARDPGSIGRGLGASLQWPPPEASPPLAQWLPSGPDYADDTVHTALLTACFQARERILVITPYLVPDESLLAALVLAARRGVVVEVFVPARSNHRMADIARNRPMRELAKVGAVFRLLPTMVHAKAVVVDDGLAFVGSANLDSRSLFLNYELTATFFEPADVARFAQWIEALRPQAHGYIAAEPGLLRSVGEGLVTWIAFQL